MNAIKVDQAIALDGHRLQVRWSDGLEGVADFGAILAKPPYCQLTAESFADVRIEPYGHTIYWLAPDGSEIDVCPDVLRAMVDPDAAERIAAEERRWHETQAAAE
ncbi:DUF2442 domain-containing protein [Aurantimonas sp. Leaf443]|uniref:DUF2442 domain-containing protein n=1 Tax=Aurantimonas sp. Leaf443 TaxID=1736378 RepID=UPI0006FCD85E|nr:DUF2442 domain-containing protein [Aurantimonas sp. Leaf443]KQT85506.1 hypothetical protein ASG48_09830 [Aurantimonas sp. Leaf443]